MTLFVFSNDNRTVLAAGIGPGATSITVAPGGGALFPSPGAGTQFALVLNDSSTRLTYEIVYCTARSGDVLTIVRAQEGTSALSWLIGDFAWNGITAGQMDQLVQREELVDDSISPWFAALKADSIDVVGNEAVGGVLFVQGGGAGVTSLQTLTGNAGAAAGHVFAALGARGYGNNSFTVNLGDYANTLLPPGSASLMIRPDGLIIQCGVVTGGLAPGASVTITLPLAFPSGSLINPLCTMDVSAASVAAEVAAGHVLSASGNNLSTSQITVSNSSSAASSSLFDITWMVIGY